MGKPRQKASRPVEEGARGRGGRIGKGKSGQSGKGNRGQLMHQPGLTLLLGDCRTYRMFSHPRKPESAALPDIVCCREPLLLRPCLKPPDVRTSRLFPMPRDRHLPPLYHVEAYLVLHQKLHTNESLCIVPPHCFGNSLRCEASGTS